MAHNLYQNKMAFAGEIPWHGLGTQFSEPFTTAQAIEAAGLGYEVTRENVYRLFNGQPIEVPGKFVTINQDNQEILGLVGDRYEIVQNRDAFGWFDEIAKETGARFTTAGALGVGERIWLMATLPDNMTPLFGDEIKKNCLLTNTHDGSGAVTIRFTPIRVVCQNTLTASMRGSKEFISLKHTESVRGRLQQTAMIVKEMNNHFTRLGETFNEMASLLIDDEWIEAYEERLFGPRPTQDASGVSQAVWQRRVNGFESRLSGGMGVDIPGVKGTRWGAYNAAVEWADYEFPIRKGTDRTESILFGRANQFKQKALEMALV